MSVKNALKKMNKAWKGAKEEFGDSTGGFDTVPDGTYVVDNITAELKEASDKAKTPGALMVAVSCKIKEGDYANQRIFSNKQLETDRGPEFLLKWLNFMGYQCDDLSEDLEEILEQISKNEDCVVKVQVKTTYDDSGAEYSNVYFNQIIEEGDVPEANEEGEEQEPEDGEPEADEFEDMDRKELKVYIRDNDLDVKVYKSMSDADIADAIRAELPEPEAEEEESEAPEEEEEEEEAPVKKKTASKNDDAKTIKGLKGLCDAFGIDYNKGDSLDTYKETMKEYTFKKKELDDKEIAALKAAGLEKLIKGK